ncbi:hemin-degrading factor [Oceanobacter sp. 3_MG-2023]|uniref:hemin-degrading factor n=1 Tax=Oceanobacter sp. 3_MG-2023 TaxID=3062622 RepID=UPI0027325710|nr:ChuX/HutX family heme-like substrate-binding protein [Oceanobacter sp. 3_MG-2023]MDP2504224.1 ChuX/HutX family heme-like substrate-binding protein [Oceanobacter sp. 3_MG-2023]
MTNVTNIHVLAEQWQSLRQQEPKMRIRDAALRLGASEGELLATRLLDGESGGGRVVRLGGDFKRLLRDIELLGEVMALTRNNAMVHEKTGQYKGLTVNGNMGLALGVIDLRIFFSRFVYGFAVEEPLPGADGMRCSLQFFNGRGEAVHKIYLTEASDQEQYTQLLARFQSEDQTPGMVLEPLPETTPETAPETTPADLDVAALRQDWSALKDVHHFQALLKKYHLNRINAYEVIGEEYATELAPEVFVAALEAAQASGLSIMLFVGSEGVIQIHTGPISNLVRTGDWFNIMDKGFNLHAKTTLIDRAWLVRKPTVDGVVSSLELYDGDGNQLALMFGERKNGQPELEGWRLILENLQQHYALEQEGVA